MKLSQISTSNIHLGLRQSLASLQREMQQAQQEVTTGYRADTGLFLGASSARQVSFQTDIDRLTTIMETNTFATGRLETTLSATTSINEIAQDLLPTLTASVSQSSSASNTALAGRNALESITAIINSTYNGEYIFGGVNSSEPPLKDFADGGGKAALDAAFLGHFGFTKDDVSAASVTKADMETFLDTVVEPMFMGNQWNTDFSNAKDDTINARIGLTETTTASVSGNEKAFRQVMFATIATAEFFNGNLSGQAQSAVATRSLEMVSLASGEIANLQGQVGFLNNRVERSSERLQLQIDQYRIDSDAMISVDPYEAATRLNSLITQIETSYTLTGRIQQLSLMRFI